MSTSINKLAEQSRRLYYKGNPSDDAEFAIGELRHLVVQAINKVLKTEHITINMPDGERFPPHHMIATYENISVVSVSDPVLGVECEQLSEQGFTTGSASMTATANADGTYTIEVTGITFDGVEPSEIESFINNCNGVITFDGLDAPNAFITLYIQDLVVDDTTITFIYHINGLPGYWETNEGDLWVTNDGFYWELPDSDATQTAPDILIEYVQDTHSILDAINIGDSDTFEFSFTNLSCCGITSDASTIKSYIILPAQPIHLPRQLGVWRVYKPNMEDDPFIPIMSGQYSQVSKISHTGLKSAMSGIICYEYFSNNRLLFNQNVGVVGTAVNVQLLVVDIATIGADDIVPVPPELEQQVVDEVVMRMANVRKMIDRKNNDIDE